MDNRDMTRERISAFADGECGDAEADIALAALHGEGEKADWELYHQIGDVLRSDDMAVGLSPGFSARMAARLEAEPLHMPPEEIQSSRKTVRTENYRRWALPGMAAAAAAAAIAFVATPQLLVATRTPQPEAAGTTMTASATDGTVLRDERIDDYLLAHQRFSPSVFSTAQYARTATFAADSNK